MQRSRPGIWLYYSIALLTFAIDYITKKIIERNLELYEQIKVIGNFFLITSIRNRGAAFGILQEQRIFFIAITIIVATGIVWYLHRSYRLGHPLLLTGLALVLGGAVGNFLDRALYGEVVDFLQFNFGSWTFPIFNLADTAIVCGVALIILDSLLAARREKDKENETHGNGDEQQLV
jgi:signal peptidase II